MRVVQLEPNVVEREKPILRSFDFKSRFQNCKTKQKFEEKRNEKPNTQSKDKEEKEKQMPEEQSKKKEKMTESFQEKQTVSLNDIAFMIDVFFYLLCNYISCYFVL